MKEDQKQIFYVVGETKSQAAMSPAIEKVKAKGYEVICISEPIDEMTLQNIEKFEDKELVDIGKEMKEELSDEEKNEKGKKNEEYEGLRSWMTKVLDGKIIRVEVSTRLVDSPATLVQVTYNRTKIV
jgi:molecular chaperone HtpG